MIMIRINQSQPSHDYDLVMIMIDLIKARIVMIMIRVNQSQNNHDYD